MEKNHENALAKMRESLEKLGCSTRNLCDATLSRFLVAKSMSPERAAKMFMEWQKWRAEIAPLGYIPESDIQDELKPRNAFLQVPAGEGSPIMILQMCKHTPSKDQLKSKKSLVHCFDKTIGSAIKGEETGKEKFIGIFDLRNIKYKNLDSRGSIAAFQILQSYYPERLEKLYFLEMPWIFASVWKMVSRLLEKATLDKIVIVTNEEERKRFVSEVGEERLPEEYGGKTKLVALQDVQINRWPLL